MQASLQCCGCYYEWTFRVTPLTAGCRDIEPRPHAPLMLMLI